MARTGRPRRQFPAPQGIWSPIAGASSPSRARHQRCHGFSPRRTKMHYPYSIPRVRDQFRLIPPTKGGLEGDDPDDHFGRPDEQPGARKRVLLVEDEFLLSAVLSADLQEFGYDVLGP